MPSELNKSGPKNPGPKKSEKPKPKDRPAARMNRTASIAEPLRRVTQPLIKKHGFSDPQIVHQWRAIVGDRLASVSCPMRLSRQNSKVRHSGGATLKVRVIGAAAPEFEHDGPQIIERINTFYGYKAVGRLALEQGPLPFHKPDLVPKPRKLSRDEEEAIEHGASGVKNPDLRRALEDLGKAIKSRQNP